MQSIKKLKAYGAMGFVRFKDYKTPEFLPLAAPLFRVDPYKPLLARFQYALKPLFEDNGVGWQMPPFIKMYVFALAFVGLFILLIAVLGILSALGKI